MASTHPANEREPAEPGSLHHTGVPGLDNVLGGGLSSGGLTIIVGPPGSGKTTLACQLLFAAAAHGSRCLVFTAFSEGPTKLIEHLRTFHFFAEDVVGTQITLLAFDSLLAGDLVDVPSSLVRIIREARPDLVLIDGFQGLEPLLGDGTATRQLLSRLAIQLQYLGTTLVITLAGDARSGALDPLLTTADAVIRLEHPLDGWREHRRLEVFKQRGRAPLGGLHTYQIDAAGITVVPRLESAPMLPIRSTPSAPAAFGLPELDALCGGGLRSGSISVLAGVLGGGKTSLALHWALTGVAAGESTVFVSLRDDPGRLQEQAAGFGLDLQAALASTRLAVLALEPVEHDPDVMMTQILTAVRERTARRLVIDDLTPLQLELGLRARYFWAALKRHLASSGATSLLVLEQEAFDGFRLDPREQVIALVADNVLMVQRQVVGGVMRRLLAVLKLRSTLQDTTLRELVVDASGLRVLAREQMDAGVLAQAAKETGGTASTTGAPVVQDPLGEPPTP